MRSDPAVRKMYALGLRVEFGPLAAPAGRDLDHVLGEGLGEAGQRRARHPEPGVVPERQEAGDDVAELVPRGMTA